MVPCDNMFANILIFCNAAEEITRILKWTKVLEEVISESDSHEQVLRFLLDKGNEFRIPVRRMHYSNLTIQCRMLSGLWLLLLLHKTHDNNRFFTHVYVYSCEEPNALLKVCANGENKT